MKAKKDVNRIIENLSHQKNVILLTVMMIKENSSKTQG